MGKSPYLWKPSTWFPIWVFSKNNGTPKSSNLIGFSIINHPFWGTPIFGNTHINSTSLLLWYVFTSRSDVFSRLSTLPHLHRCLPTGILCNGFFQPTASWATDFCQFPTASTVMSRWWVFTTSLHWNNKKKWKWTFPAPRWRLFRHPSWRFVSFSISPCLLSTGAYLCYHDRTRLCSSKPCEVMCWNGATTNDLSNWNTITLQIILWVLSEYLIHLNTLGVLDVPILFIGIQANLSIQTERRK